MYEWPLPRGSQSHRTYVFLRSQEQIGWIENAADVWFFAERIFDYFWNIHSLEIVRSRCYFNWILLLYSVQEHFIYIVCKSKFHSMPNVVNRVMCIILHCRAEEFRPLTVYEMAGALCLYASDKFITRAETKISYHIICFLVRIWLKLLCHPK